MLFRSKEDSPVPISLPSNSQNLAMEIASSQNSEGSLTTSYQTLILEAYGAIGEPDSVYGAGAGRLADIDSRIRTYMHEHAWDKALGMDLCTQYMNCSEEKCPARQLFSRECVSFIETKFTHSKVDVA